MVHAAPDLDLHRHAQDLRQTWQARVLIHAKGQVAGVVLSVLSHNFDDVMPVLLRVVFPGFTSITAPFYCTAAKIDKAGQVVADLVTKDGKIIKDSVAFPSEIVMRGVFRRLADELKLSNHERVELFSAACRWVVADRRIDPNMHPMDPDAKRLVH